MRLRVGGRTPACARDGLTGCWCRDGRKQLGHLADEAASSVQRRNRRVQPPHSVLQELEALTDGKRASRLAIRSNVPGYSVRLATKGAPSGWKIGIKAASAEGASGSLLPPTLLERAYELHYESDSCSSTSRVRRPALYECVRLRTSVGRHRNDVERPERMADLTKSPRRTAPEGPNRAARRHYVKPNEAAEYLGVTARTIRQMIANGRLTGYRSGSRFVRIDLSEIDAAM